MLSKALFSILLGGAAMPLLASAQSCSVASNLDITFYGNPDNDPAGSTATAYDCGAGRNFNAGGSGSYNDPLTFATAQGEFKTCEIVYFPYIKKYIRMEDYCQTCTEDWAVGRWHIDIWTGNNVNGGNTQVQCENSLTPGPDQWVIRNPSPNLEVDLTELFVNPRTCNTNHVYLNNPASKYCSTGSNPGGGCQTDCAWQGHCLGCSCATFNDCDEDFICTNGVCSH
ncbi:uncharacterized protein B0I36DRAFT_344776 [Microdochium trichocladiopsis]|uniref:Chitin-binding type-4 domain-containing protein n=1 Tax=Microdochium trichocladiopsis TaxID=1682393 RepID=A0A9P8YG85_9PEZI|nr:uncharacterized protein B0I36DRAFT_344776 [Microdochium trichocladiopsis]KAH7041147.1 hypothetical protein B0I36DRAFT_344776 [Microdochium trichocladiopsis]